ncbi:hypothetical protein PMZ80_004278 [Knufia obscura]|uniref:Uncharacterized protein n=2 Tax=Knufia TaxID=430999 RepID=A0AAN8E8Z5_9EURO|nr:hypothetical protein PMZ80_004278 [Knufia obscura]KAK5949224.1 hypothetical protein OHC33_009765 [Knufia fluminis]
MFVDIKPQMLSEIEAVQTPTLQHAYLSNTTDSSTKAVPNVFGVPDDTTRNSSNDSTRTPKDEKTP